MKGPVARCICRATNMKEMKTPQNPDRLITPLVEPDNAPDLPKVAGRVELAHVSFAYKPDEIVLHDLNLVVEPGQTIALVGPTGAGKSSIANLIARMYDVTQGAVLIDGIDVRTVAQQSLRRQTGRPT